MMGSNSDSLLDEMEPRILRPILPPITNRGIQMQAQVSEPSLFSSENFLSPFKEVLGPLQSHREDPRAKVKQMSPIKNPIFTPVKCTPKSLMNNSRESPSCSCKSSGVMSPSIDPEIKELIQDQNKQLQILQKQVEQLLNYQTQLQRKNDNAKCHEATQTSFLDSPNTESPREPTVTPPKRNGCSSTQRFTAQERTEFTLTFRDLQLETIMEQPPSPQPSIVVNMQDYPDSISERPENDSVSESCSTVMEHVQRLLAQANFTEKRSVLTEKSYENVQSHTKKGHGMGIENNPVRKVTMQRVQELGISFVTPGNINNFQSGSIHYPRHPRGPQLQQLESRKETDQSVEMMMLAEKYLGQRNNFLSKIDQPQANRKPVEMSMSTQQYLERYGLTENNSFFHG